LPVGQLLGIVVMASRSGEDPVLPFLIWMAAEPLVIRNTEESLVWLAENGADGMPLTGTLMRKVMRRLCDTGEGARIDLAMDFIERTAGTSPAFAAAAMEGLIEGQKGRAVLPATDPEAIVGRWIEHSDARISRLARQLGTLWGNEAAVKSSFALVLDAAAPASERRNAIRAIREQKNEAARDTLLQLVAREPDSGLAIDAIQTLGEIGGDAVAAALIEPWKRFTPRARQEAAAVLVSRPRWASSFLSAIEQVKIAAGDVPATAVRALVRSDADYGMLAKRASQVFGRVRDADADKLKLIAEKRKVVLSGEPDLEAGREVARQACLVCHKLHDQGGEVGPDLTGVGRSSLDALLANIIDPNQIIGKGYEHVEVETKEGRVVGGRLVEETDSRVKLFMAGPSEEVIAKSDIERMQVSEFSVMPEGLEQIPDDDFRNMVWYILNPPEDNRPMTPELRRELIGGEP
jgi:putative heme-binding domain-containing protein